MYSVLIFGRLRKIFSAIFTWRNARSTHPTMRSHFLSYSATSASLISPPGTTVSLVGNSHPAMISANRSVFWRPARTSDPLRGVPMYMNRPLGSGNTSTQPSFCIERDKGCGEHHSIAGVNPLLNIIEEILRDIRILSRRLCAGCARRDTVCRAIDHDELLVLTGGHFIMNFVVANEIVPSHGREQDGRRYPLHGARR